MSKATYSGVSKQSNMVIFQIREQYQPISLEVN